MTTRRRIAVFRWLALLSVVPVACVVVYLMRDELTLQRLAEHDMFVRQICGDYPVLMSAAAFVAFVVATTISVPGAAGMAMACGWLFGFRGGLILVSCASTTGAILAFLLSRWLLRNSVRERFAGPLREIELVLEHDGAFYLLVLRLVPAVPYFVINIVMGLTPISLRTFWWVSQLGMLPGTVLYVAAGASIPTLSVLVRQGVTGVVTLKVLGAFTALGLLPLFARWLFLQRRALRRMTKTADS